MTRWLTGLLLVISTALAQAPSAPKKTLPWEKQRSLLGQDLFREHCAVCHDIDKQKSKKFGPSLYHLFKNEKLPLSGGKPSRAYAEVKIKFGGALMPPFIKKMTDAEIAALIGYIETK